jgi:hypothetical protein
MITSDLSCPRITHQTYTYTTPPNNIQGVTGEKVNILGGHSIGHSKQKSLYVRVSYSERFPR